MTDMLTSIDIEEAKRLAEKGKNLAVEEGGMAYTGVVPIYQESGFGTMHGIGLCLKYEDTRFSPTQLRGIIQSIEKVLLEEENRSRLSIENDIKEDGKVNRKRKVISLQGRREGRRTHIYIKPHSQPRFERKQLPLTIEGYVDGGRSRYYHQIDKTWNRYATNIPTMTKFIDALGDNSYDIDVQIREPEAFDLIRNPLTFGLILGQNKPLTKVERYTKTLEALILERQQKVYSQDIGGLKKLKEELEIKYIDSIANKSLGIEPSNAILTGQPGTGKTMLLSYLINSATGVVRIPFQTEFLTPMLGEKHAFSAFVGWLDEISNQTGKPVYVFWDEIEEIGSRWEGDWSNTSKQILRVLSGQKRHNFYFIGATNRPDMLDPAFIRPGRFYPVYWVGLPTKDERQEILQIIGKKAGLEGLDWQLLAEKTEYFTGAHLKEMFDAARIKKIKQLKREGADITKLKNLNIEQDYFLQHIEEVRDLLKEENTNWSFYLNKFMGSLDRKIATQIQTRAYII